MVNNRLLKKTKEDYASFVEGLDTFNVEGLENETEVESLTPTHTWFAEDLNDVVSGVVSKDTHITTLGKGILRLVVEKDCTLEIISEKASAVQVEIRVKQGVSCKLIQKGVGKEVNQYIVSYIEKDATLKHAQVTQNATIILSESFLEERSTYDLKGVYSSDSVTTYIQNAARHLGEHSSSEMNINGVAQNKAQVVNDGVIEIKQSAPKSSGHQKLKNLILDDVSSIQSEPILEIYNNDVKCSHGSSISQISDDIVFYMQTRGMQREEVIELIVQGFFDVVLEKELEV